MKNIIKPKLDLRDFCGDKLDNGIKYIFINDKYLETSYVSIAINVGTYADTAYGLAHFLEHMLFMGSKKYPDVDYFFNKLKELGGTSNAYTDKFNTVYYFDIFNSGLNEIFDIFSRFFIDPLFKKESIEKEMNAVNNEHLKNINNDNWKLDYFINFISDTNSSINKFGTGSLETLNVPNIRELLIDFYNKYYITENISICIASSLSFDKLYKMINNTFGKIKKNDNNSNLSKYIIQKPFYNNNILKTYHLIALSKIYKLIYIWEIPILKDYLESKDFDILEYILLNNSENSLSYHFHNLGLTINLNIDILFEGKFIFYLSLTEKGFSHTDYIESVIFSYLNYIYTLNLNEYVKYIIQISDFNFNYNNKIETGNDLCNILATQHFLINTKYVLKNLMSMNPKGRKYSLNKLYKENINSDNFIKILISDKKIGIYKYKELIYYKNTFYGEILSNTKVKLRSNQILKLNIRDNKYLDSNIKLINNLDEFNIPILISNGLWREWYGACSKFNEPIINIFLQLNNNKYFNSCHNFLLTNISCNIINFILSIKFYKVFDLSYNISLSSNSTLSSIFINIKSLNDINKLKLLINDLYHFLENISENVNKISNHFIENLLLSYENMYNNIKFSNPYEYSCYLINLSILPNIYSSKELLFNLKKINNNILKKYIINELFKEVNLTILTYGNTYLFNNLFDKFKNIFILQTNKYVEPYPSNNILQNIIIKHPNKNETSICVNYLFNIGPFVPKICLLMNLTIKIFSQQFFNILRTQKQFGYLVKMSTSNYNDNYYIVKIEK